MLDKPLDRLLNNCIKTHATEIANICLSGGIAVAVFEPGMQWVTLLLSLGWDEHSSVFEMPGRMKRRLATSDQVTYRWINRRFRDGDPLRIFVAMHGGSLLLNFHPGIGGYTLEPGSTDSELASVPVN